MEPWAVDAAMLAGEWQDDKPFRDALVHAMRLARERAFMATTEQDQFKAAVATALMRAGLEDNAWVQDQLEIAKKLEALLVAGQAGLAVNLSEADLPKENPRSYTLLGLWRESKRP